VLTFFKKLYHMQGQVPNLPSDYAFRAGLELAPASNFWHPSYQPKSSLHFLLFRIVFKLTLSESGFSGLKDFQDVAIILLIP
jgi:hypothetical protein